MHSEYTLALRNDVVQLLSRCCSDAIRFSPQMDLNLTEQPSEIFAKNRDF